MVCMVVGHSYLGGGCLVSSPEVSPFHSSLDDCVLRFLKSSITNSMQDSTRNRY